MDPKKLKKAHHFASTGSSLLVNFSNSLEIKRLQIKQI